MFFDVDESEQEEIRRAIRMRAGVDGTNTSEVILQSIRAHLAKEIQEARQAIAKKPAGETKGKKKGE